MQTILVTTDFNPSSLNCIPSLCRQFGETELNFVFIHLFKLSDSISDLLMLSRRTREFEHVSPEFYERCREIKKQYPQVKCLKIEFFYGSTLIMFKDFLEANDVRYILDPADCSVSKINKSSIDPNVLIQKCGLPVIRAEKDTTATIRPLSAASPIRENVLEEVSL